MAKMGCMQSDRTLGLENKGLTCYCDFDRFRASCSMVLSQFI